MKLRVLVTFLGVTTLLLLASAILAQEPEALGRELQQVPLPEPEGRLREPETETLLSDRQGWQLLGERPAAPSAPPLLEGSRVVEPPEPPAPGSDWPPSDLSFTLLQEASPAFQPLELDVFLFSQEPFFAAATPRSVPLLSGGEMGILGATSAITVVETYDYVWGFHEHTDDTLLLRLYDGTTLKGFGVARTDGMGYFHGQFFDQGSPVGIDPGDTVKVGNGVTTDTIEIVHITGAADPLNHVVAGAITGTGLSLPASVTLSFPWAGIRDTVSTDGSGDFTADFSATYDMCTTDAAEASYEDDGGNWVSAWLPPLGFFCAAETSDEVGGFAAPGATLTITRTPQTGPPASETTTASTADGRYVVGFSEVAPDDVIKVDDGTSVISTTVVSLTATATPWANDIISGTAPSSSDVGVAVYQVSPSGYLKWYRQTVSSDGSGDFAADFSTILDLDRLSKVSVIYPDASGNETIVQYRPPLAAINETYNNIWGISAPGSQITATLKDSLGAIKDTQSTTGDQAFGGYQMEFQDDVQTGDSVEVTGSGISTTVAVTTLTALADTYADTISGLSPASSELIVSAWRQGHIPAPRFDELVTSTGASTYSDDLSGRYDLYNGYQGHVYYSQPDEHKTFVHFHAPSVNVDQTHDGAYGYVDTANTEVTVTLRSGGGGFEGQVVITSDPNDGSFKAWYDDSVSIDPGDTVQVETSSWTTVVTMTDFSLDFDTETETVWGTGPANTMMSLFIMDGGWGYLGETAVPTDESGNFTADFSDVVDILGAQWIGLGRDDEDHNFNYVFGRVPYLRVSLTHEWIQGLAAPDATVNITVTRGSNTFTTSTTAGGDGEFFVGGWQFGAEFLDFQSGDLVEMNADGIYRSLHLVAMTGDPDLDADAISGHIAGADEGEPVLVEIWDKEGGSVQATTDASGNYCADLSFRDVLAGHQISVWYITPDGDECGIAVRYLQIRANLSAGSIDGDTKPEATVNITVTGSGEKGFAETTADEDGYYGAKVYTDSTKVFFGFGDTVHASADGRAASLFIEGPLTAQADDATDVISGTAPGNRDLIVDIWEHGQFNTQSDESGHYAFDAWAEAGIDLRTGMGGMVGYLTTDGHQVSVDFWLPFMRVNQSHDWVGGRVLSSATVDVTVTRGLDVFTATTTSQPDGWFQVGGVDIQVDDLVEIGCDSVRGSVTVVTMTGELNTMANTLSGNIAGASEAPVRVEISEEDGWSVDVTTEEDGDYSADLYPWELKAGDTVAVWYITSDGDELGAVFEMPFARINYTGDGVDGRVAPYATVYVTVTHGTVKGTANGPAGSDGWFGLYAGADVVPGDTVYATSPGGLDATMEVITITGDVDLDTDIVWGVMAGGDFPAKGYVAVGRPPHWDPNDSREIDIDADGKYSADFSEFDIQFGDEVQVWYRQLDGNEIGISLQTAPLRSLRVHQTHNWLQIEGKPGNTVYVTLTNGVIKGTSTVVIEDNGWGWTRIYSGTDEVDIEAGDVVEASTEAVMRSAEVITMTGLVDPAENTVQGEIDAPEHPADLHVETWVPGVKAGKEGHTDDFGWYEVDLDPEYDVQMGDELCVWYHDPDGDQVGSLFSGLRLEVSSSNDDFGGQTGPPGTTITLTLRDGVGTLKGQTTRTANEDGRFAGIFGDGSQTDIQPGDTLEAETAVLADSVYVLPLPATFDVDEDLLSGTCVADGYVYIGVGREHASMYLENIPTDSGGNFTIDFQTEQGGFWDLRMGDHVDLNCRIPEGHWVHRGFTVQAYYAYVPLVLKSYAGLSVAGLPAPPVVTSTPTSAPLPTPTPTVEPTPTDTPTLVPTVTPTATAVISVTATATLTPTASLEEALTPSPEGS